MNTSILKVAIWGFISLMAFSCTDAEKLKMDRSISHGIVLYQNNCIQCHGEDGQGLGTLYPPLAESDYLKKYPDSLACMIKWGMKGIIVVNGVEYNQPMPGNDKLFDEEIAHLINYIQNAWGNEGEFVSPDKVGSNLSNCY